jgi:uncharacterized protein (DUF433 family)
MCRAEPKRHVHGDAGDALPFGTDVDPVGIKVLLAAEFALAREGDRVFVGRHPESLRRQRHELRAPCSARQAGICSPSRFTVDEKDLLERITYNPQIFGGKPIVRGHRLAVEHVLGMLAAGDTIETVVSGYPWMEREDALACLAYARRVVGHD